MKTLRLLPNLSSLSIGAPGTSEGEGGGVHSLVATCLFYDFGTYSTGKEGKYASEKDKFDSSQNFVDTFEFMLNNFKYASDLSTKKLDFSETKLPEDTQTELPHQPILAILEQAQNQLRKGGARAYYLRRDLSDKRAVYVVGDVHGSLHSLCEIFTHMNEELAFDVNGRLKDEVHVVFTGDIMDRSPYTLECAYLVLRLFVENPQNVTLTLGNHEKDAYLWESTDGSRREMKHEYPESFDRLLREFKNTFKYFPRSFIAKTKLGTIQFNHGTFQRSTEQNPYFKMFVGFNTEMEDTFPISESKEDPLAWGDLTTKMDEESSSLGKRSSKNAEELASYLTEYGIRMLIRGHQDRANLSLVYKDGEKPSEELQSESAGSSLEEEDVWTFGNDLVFRDKRQKEDRHPHATFVLDLKDVENEEVYDMWTLSFGPNNREPVTKTLVRTDRPPEDSQNALIAVTTSTAVYPKLLPPMMTRTSFLKIS